MSIIHITQFNGLLPRYNNSRTHGDYATVALDVDLSKGDLRPYRTAKLIKAGEFDNIYYCGCEIQPLGECSTSTSLINGCEYSIVSDNDGESRIACGVCEGVQLAVPTPLYAPTVLGGEPASRTTDAIYYVYTFVDALGRESITSPPSITFRNEDGSPVIVSNFTGWQGGCVSHVNIYRSGTGYRSGTEEVQEDATSLVLVGTTDVNDVLFDHMRLKDSGKLCTAMDNFPPPDGLRQIQLHESTNQLVGFVGNKVFFSTGSHSHVFPVEYEITIPIEHTNKSILTIKTCRVTDVVYVFTPEDVFVIYDITCEPKQCFKVKRLRAPIYTGLSSHVGITDTPYGVVYVSRLGLISLTPSGYSILTANWFSESDWATMGIHTMRIGFDIDSLFFTSDTHSYKLQVDDITGAINSRNLVELSYSPKRYVKSPTDELLMIMDDGVYQWNAGDEHLVMDWVKEFRQHSKTHYTRGMVENDGLNNVTINDLEFKYPIDDSIGRFKRDVRRRRHTLRIQGKYPTYDVLFGSTTREMVNALTK